MNDLFVEAVWLVLCRSQIVSLQCLLW